MRRSGGWRTRRLNKPCKKRYALHVCIELTLFVLLCLLHVTLKSTFSLQLSCQLSCAQEKARQIKVQATMKKERNRERRAAQRTRERSTKVESVQAAEVGELKRQLMHLSQSMSTAQAVKEALDKQSKAHDKQLQVLA